MSRAGKPFLLAILLTISTGLAAQEFRTTESDGFVLRWRVVDDNLEVEVSAPTTGWVGVGFDPSNMMRGANIIIGYVAGNDVTISDEYGSGRTAHRPDTQLGGESSLSDVSGSEENGRTTISFTMPLVSGEDTDAELVPGNRHTVMMAHGPNGADNLRSYHGGNRTIVTITL